MEKNYQLENLVRTFSKPVQRAIEKHFRRYDFQKGVTIFIHEGAFRLTEKDGVRTVDELSVAKLNTAIRNKAYWDASQQGVRPMVHYSEDHPVQIAEITNFYAMTCHLKMVEECGSSIPVRYVVVRKRLAITTYENAGQMLDEIFTVKG